MVGTSVRKAVVVEFIGAAALTIAASLAGGFAPSPAAAQDVDRRPDVVVDGAATRAAIETLLRRIDEDYPVPEIGRRTVRTLRARLRSGAYDGMTSARAFSEALTRDLREASGDRHFTVEYFVVPRQFPEAAAAAGPQPASQLPFRLSAGANFGFVRVERLAGNIGYLRLDRFAPTAEAGETAAAAMQFLASSDALIIDLRENRGGHADMIALLASYLVREPSLLSEIRSRTELKQLWTAAFVPGRRYLERPVYVLTSSNTFSAAEGLAYDLQALGRVKVVGEITAGGANPISRVLLSERFGASIPAAQARNPITGTNWQGVGVQPDVRTPAAEALDTAHLLAVRAIAPAHTDDGLTAELRETEARLAAGSAPR